METSELQKVISTMIEEKTFSLEGVKAIEEMRDRNIMFQREIKTLGEAINGHKENVEFLGNEITDLHTKNNVWKQRHDELTKREEATATAQMNISVAQASEAAYRNCFDAITKNTIIRETTQKTVGQPPVPHPSGHMEYPADTAVNKTKTTEQE